jgi:hypothetical protein
MQITRRSSRRRWKRPVVLANNFPELLTSEIFQAKTNPVLNIEANLKLRHDTIKRMRAGANETSPISVHQRE